MCKERIDLYIADQKIIINQENYCGFNIFCDLKKVADGYVLKRTIKNITTAKQNLKEIKASITGISFGKAAKDDYFYTNENARIFCNLSIPVDYVRNDDSNEKNCIFGLDVDRKWCDPGVAEGRICSSPYQPFPAILLSNYQTKDGVVCGSLSQDVFYHSFDVYHIDGELRLDVYSSFKGIEYREINPEEELTDILYIGETNNADDINKIFSKYTSVLRKYLKNKGLRNVNRHTLIWDSWNDGIYRNVSEEMLLKEAKAVKELFPTVEWFELDDGYSTYNVENVDCDSHGLGVPYENENGICKVKFPNGLKNYTDKIKEIGLKPAVWVGGFCPVRTEIYKDHPEWFIDYTYRVDGSQPLDVSKKEVRDYMIFAISKFFDEYGFEGIKHDFWSYAFEDRNDLLFNKEKSGYEYRTWWLKEIRKKLPEYGYMESCCDLSMANPFLGEYFNNYRFGIDIGSGNWDKIKTTMFWSVAVLSTHTGDLFIPNSDSIGMLPGLNDTDFMFVVNFQIITRTLVEISGRFSSVLPNNPRLKILKRAVSYLNNGEDVYFAKYDYRQKGVLLPEIIYINSPCFACEDEQKDAIKSFALFNYEETENEISFNLSDLGINDKVCIFTDVWSGENKEINKTFSIFLNAHESKLFTVKLK